MQKEIQALEDNGTYEISNLPPVKWLSDVYGFENQI